jgi:hypothetical protein
MVVIDKRKARCWMQLITRRIRMATIEVSIDASYHRQHWYKACCKCGKDLSQTEARWFIKIQKEGEEPGALCKSCSEESLKLLQTKSTVGV